jgi:drug/metabolite transporter (DMT)-like permease
VTRRGWILFAAMGVIWGIPYLLIKVAVRDVTPAVLVLGRTGIGTALLLPIAAMRGELRPVLSRWKPLVAYTVAEVIVPWFLLSDAERRLSSSLTGLLVAAVPLCGAALAWATRTASGLGLRQVTGLVVGIAGVAALVGFDATGGDGLSFAGMGVVAIGYATGPFILSRFLSDLPSLGVVAASLALCGLFYCPFALTELPSAVPPARVIAAVVALGVVCTAAAFVVFFHLIREIGALRATVITYVNPAVALVLGVWFLGESFTWGTGLGFFLILVGSLLATRSGAPVARPIESARPSGTNR